MSNSLVVVEDEEEGDDGGRAKGEGTWLTTKPWIHSMDWLHLVALWKKRER